MQKRPHWSYSSLSEYQMCPQKYYFHRVEQRIPEFINANLILGKALHGIYSQVMTLLYPIEDEPISITDIEMLFESLFKGENIFYGNSSYEEELVKGKKYCQVIINYLRGKTFQKQEVWLEKEFTVPLILKDGVMEYPLTGVFKVVTINHYKKMIKIINFKTAKYPDWKIFCNLKMQTYIYAIKQMFPKEYKIVFRWEVLFKQKAPRIIAYECLSTDDNNFPKIAKSIEQSIENSVFYPKTSYLCISCEYFQICKDLVNVEQLVCV